MFIPPAWHLSRQCIEALKELNFSMSESMTDIEFIQKGKKYILHPVMNWDQQGDKATNIQTVPQNTEMFYNRLFDVNGKTNRLYRIFRFCPRLGFQGRTIVRSSPDHHPRNSRLSPKAVEVRV